jgi:hypothetical protein
MANEYGLLLENRFKYGSEQIVARLVKRENGGEHPLGCSSDGEWLDVQKPHAYRRYDGLGLYGFVTDKEQHFIGAGEPKYRDVYEMNVHDLVAMTRTLNTVNRALTKAQVREAGDILYIFAKSLSLTFVVERIENGRAERSTYSENEWHFMTLAQGRERYRELIRQAQDKCRQRLAG